MMGSIFCKAFLCGSPVEMIASECRGLESGRSDILGSRKLYISDDYASKSRGTLHYLRGGSAAAGF